MMKAQHRISARANGVGIWGRPDTLAPDIAYIEPGQYIVGDVQNQLDDAPFISLKSFAEMRLQLVERLASQVWHTNWKNSENGLIPSEVRGGEGDFLAYLIKRSQRFKAISVFSLEYQGIFLDLGGSLPVGSVFRSHSSELETQQVIYQQVVSDIKPQRYSAKQLQPSISLRDFSETEIAGMVHDTWHNDIRRVLFPKSSLEPH